MQPWLKAVVLLALATTVVCNPFLNDLLPGKEYPQRGSFKQPYNQEPEKVPEKASVESGIPIAVTQESQDKGEKQVLNNKEAEDTKSKRETTEVQVENVKPEIEEIVTEHIEDESKSEDLVSIPKSVDVTKAEENKVDYSGAQLWKVSTEKANARTAISRLRRRNLISPWGGNHTYVDLLIKPEAIQNVSKVFKAGNISYNIMIEDLQKVIETENPPLDENEIELQDRRGHRMTWKQYHRLDDIHGFLDFLAKTYPAIVSVQNIGKSHQGRDLKVIRVSDGKPTNKAVFIDGGIHAREWISPATVTYFINQFVENFDIESDDVRNISWYFLPVVNPDGYEYTHTNDRLWRKNRNPGLGIRQCSGTDLNRNFGYRWGGKGASKNPCSEIYCGSRAFSEPESKALSNFIKNSSEKFSAYITYHSYGQYLLYPWGYDNVVPPDYKDLDALGNKIAEAIRESGGSQYSVGSSSGLLYPASGGSDDWAKSQGIKYTYTIELSDTGRYGFILPTTFIVPIAKENLSGLRVLAKTVNTE